MSKELEAFERIKTEGDIEGNELHCFMNDDDINIVENGLKRLESIENANPSEALECLEKIIDYYNEPLYELGGGYYENELIESCENEVNTIKQALIKAEKEHNSLNLLMQELDCKDFAELRKYARCGYEKLNKKYLKWEDLEFDNNAEVKKYLKVKLGENIYSAFYHYSFLMNCEMFCIARDTLSLYITDKQFFNDLHLERVEE